MLDFLRVTFSAMGVQVDTPLLRISRKTCPIWIKVYSIGKQPILSILKAKKWWHHVLYAKVICLFITR